MSTLAPNLGRDTEIRIDGKVYYAGRLTIDVLEKFIEWVRPQLPDPFDGLDRLVEKLPPEMAMQLIRQAQDEKKTLLDWDAPIIQKYRETKRGQLVTFWHMLQVNHPDLTFDDAFQIAAAMGERKLAETFENAAGKTPSLPNVQAPAA